jgi:hypothetical protein
MRGDVALSPSQASRFAKLREVLIRLLEESPPDLGLALSFRIKLFRRRRVTH